MGRRKVPEGEKIKRQPFFASDNAWREFTAVADREGHETSALIRAFIEDFIAGRYSPFPRSK